MMDSINLILSKLLFSFGLIICMDAVGQEMASKLPPGKWEAVKELSDEFNAPVLDSFRWSPFNPEWEGRPPALFSANNVQLNNGYLCLTAKTDSMAKFPEGFHTFTSAAVKSKTRVLYGYFEIRCKPMDSQFSSAFWFYADDPTIWTEIDVFEICGKHPVKSWEYKYFNTVHVFRTPADGEKHWMLNETWIAPWRLADRFMVCGLEWDKDKIKWYVDGKLIRTIENTHWHQSLTMNFDLETQPGWMGLPNINDVSGNFQIDYVRSWKKINN